MDYLFPEIRGPTDENKEMFNSYVKGSEKSVEHLAEFVKSVLPSAFELRKVIKDRTERYLKTIEDELVKEFLFPPLCLDLNTDENVEMLQKLKKQAYCTWDKVYESLDVTLPPNEPQDFTIQ